MQSSVAMFEGQLGRVIEPGMPADADVTHINHLWFFFLLLLVQKHQFVLFCNLLYFHSGPNNILMSYNVGI